MHILYWQDHGMPNDPNLSNDIFYLMINYIRKEREENNKRQLLCIVLLGLEELEL